MPVDGLATPGEWGVAKPAAVAGDVLYVGDHRDNDVVAAKAAGLRTALIRRGPWGYLWADDPMVRRDADWVIDSLHDLPGLLANA